MNHDPDALNAALAAAVGEDAALRQELKAAFLASAALHASMMGRARCDANWRVAAWRLKGLAASFGALELMREAEEAATGAPGDPVALCRIRDAIADFSY